MSFKLCYIENNFAYFTTQELNDQWGDGWGYSPYGHNAGTPYGPYKKGESWEIKKVAFDVDLQEPADYHYNSPYSVQQINKGYVPWLVDNYGNSGVVINAGASIEEFITKIHQADGEIYILLEENKNETK